MIEVKLEDAPLAKKWLDAGRGLAMWCHREKNNPSVSIVPAFDQKGNPENVPPHPWCAEHPAIVVMTPDKVMVKGSEVVDRFIVWAKQSQKQRGLKPHFQKLISKKMEDLGDGHWFEVTFETPTRGLCKIFKLTLYERLDKVNL